MYVHISNQLYSKYKKELQTKPKITSAPIETLKVLLSSLLENYDKPTNQPTEKATNKPSFSQ